ncbi:HEWD family protein [Halococcus sp. IIIV-5B]|uniref:HEWD family protein n=2 Tax=Halococcus TaxID=2249 RepID=UPI000E73D763|nr:HEWD family protein [Halococcus sp. IIIV-5B]RJT06710.1 hypothetical protein D3261_04125 [Halococcus sp. IIIV-5B]
MSEPEPLSPPQERECVLCGRQDVWNDEETNWRIAREGDAHCIHEWDINGTYNPFQNDSRATE